MTVWLMFGVAVFAVLASAQTADTPVRSGAALLVLPRSGVPVSLEQIEERSRKGDGDTSAVEITKSKVYRDSGGRIRMESDIRDASGHSSTYTNIIDPVAGSSVVLLSSVKIAYRMPGPKGDARLGSVIAGELSSSHNWTARTETAGKRIIEGIEFEGTRIIQTAEGEPSLTYTIEHWHSEELKLTGLEVDSGPYGTHTARIQNLRRDEPDPVLFTIPSGYNIVDVKLPDQQ